MNIARVWRCSWTTPELPTAAAAREREKERLRLLERETRRRRKEKERERGEFSRQERDGQTDIYSTHASHIIPPSSL